MTDFFEHIGDYKSGALKGEALQAFEAEVAKNDELRKAVDNHDVVEEMMELMWEDEIRRVMKDEDGHVLKTTEKTNRILSIKPLLAIAASLLVLIAAFTFMYNANKSLSGQELFAKHYSPYIESNITRGEEGAQINLSSCDLGHSLMEEGEYDQAKNVFMENLADQPNECVEKSEWYLALYYLRIENLMERDKLLNEILNDPQHSYHQKALKLQADLN